MLYCATTFAARAAAGAGRTRPPAGRLRSGRGRGSLLCSSHGRSIFRCDFVLSSSDGTSTSISAAGSRGAMRGGCCRALRLLLHGRRRVRSAPQHPAAGSAAAATAAAAGGGERRRLCKALHGSATARVNRADFRPPSLHSSHTNTVRPPTLLRAHSAPRAHRAHVLGQGAGRSAAVAVALARRRLDLVVVARRRALDLAAVPV